MGNQSIYYAYIRRLFFFTCAGSEDSVETVEHAILRLSFCLLLTLL